MTNGMMPSQGMWGVHRIEMPPHSFNAIYNPSGGTTGYNFTISNVELGIAHQQRNIIAAITYADSSQITNSFSINGVIGTLLYKSGTYSVHSDCWTALYTVPENESKTGNLIINFSGSVSRAPISISLYSLYGLSLDSIIEINGTNNNQLIQNVTKVQGGFIIFTGSINTAGVIFNTISKPGVDTAVIAGHAGWGASGYSFVTETSYTQDYTLRFSTNNTKQVCSFSFIPL